MPYRKFESIPLQRRVIELSVPQPVVFLTARTEAEDEAKGFELGSVDYIHKPFNPTVVRARVHTHLLLRDTLKQIEERTAALDEKDQDAGEPVGIAAP